MQREEVIETIQAFLDRIGIPCAQGSVEGDTFLPGLEIAEGSIRYDPERLTYPGDLLHEAGHIALTRPAARAMLSQEDLGNQNPNQSEEIGVILWTYFAVLEIGIPPETVFHAGGYKSQGNWLMEQFGSGTYIGLPLLQWMGVTEPAAPGERPAIKSWLRTTGE